MAFYKAGSATGGFDGGVRDALSAILASPHFLYRAESGVGTSGDAHADRSGAGVAPVLLPVEQPAGRGAAEGRYRIASQQSRRAGRAGEPDARRPAREVAERRLRVPVAARREAGRDHAGPGPVPARERTAGSARAVQGGAAAVHRQRAAQRPQRVRPADRGLHVPQRAAGDALRHRDGEGQPLPPRDARQPGAPRPAGQGRRS